ncbi:MAG: trehalase family glycosidase [Bacteroidota bacterium]
MNQTSMDLMNQAKRVLAGNWRDGFSIPTSNLYPFQWNWDSGFVSMGMAHVELEKALEEIDSLFSGQWENGMLPHIIFHSEDETSYFPNYDFWDTGVNPGAPQKPKTSGITQPPVFGFVLAEILKNTPRTEEVKRFIKQLFPKILHYHRFLYTYRDPEQEGLFFIFHPWESGRDNSPIWDESMNRIQVDPAQLPAYTRKDTQIADASERPTADKYDRYVYLLELGKKYGYDGPEIAKESPFLVQDCMMNAILIQSNESLIEIGRDLDLDTGELEEWQRLSKKNFSKKFWNEELRFFVSFDARENKQMSYKEIGGLVPLFGGCATTEQAAQLAAYLQKIHDKGFFLCPSFDIDDPLFDSKRYWRGPVWPQMNWLIYRGLKSYGYHELAETVRSDLLELTSQLGFFEYFESEKNKLSSLSRGYGGDNFSWTASTVISLLNEPT